MIPDVVNIIEAKVHDKEDENKIITIITNQLDREYNTIAELYKKRWDIELFFKSLKKTFKSKPFGELVKT